VTLLRRIGIIAGLLLVLGGTPAAGQSSADAFFHDAAQRYVNGDLEAARRAVEQGLNASPSDPRLRALQKKLEQQEERRGGGSSGQGGQSQQQRQDRQKRQSLDGDNAQQEQSGDSGQNPRSQSDAASDRESSRRAGSQSDRAGNDMQSRGSEGTQGGTRRSDRRPANTVSRAQAARLLRALENQEMKLLREVQVRTQEGATVEKDW